MSNIVVAELVAVTVAGEQVRAAIAEVLEHYVDADGRFADLRLADGARVDRADVLDIELTAVARRDLLAA